MIIDSSAVIAILVREPERESFLRQIRSDRSSKISVASYVEAGIVVDSRRDPSMSRAVDRLLRTLSVTVAPFTPEQARIARQAYRDYGRGSGHPAKLNFGDCLSYALAAETGEPMLFKGNDFIHTDVVPAAEEEL